MHPRVRDILWVVIGLALTALPVIAISGLPQMIDGNGHYYFQDFINYWGAPRIAQHDATLLASPTTYMQALNAEHGAALPKHNWSYPLHSLLLLLPFSLPPLPVAFLLWTLAGLIFYGWTLTRLMADQPKRALVLGLLAPASLINGWAAQNGFFTASLFLWALHALQQKQPRRAGLWLGLLTVKPHLGLIWPVVLLIQRRWATIATALATLCLLLACSLVWLGADAWRAYIATAIPFQQSLVREAPLNELFRTMMPSIPLSLQLWGVDRITAYAVQVFVSLAVFAAVGWRLRRPMDPAHQCLLLTSAALLLIPYLFNYDMTAFTAALVMVMLHASPRHWLGWCALGLGYMAPALVYWCYHFFPIAPLCILAPFFYALADMGRAPSATTPPA